MKTAVIYKSKYGATKRYAEWISEELQCPIFEHSQIKSADLDAYDLIIYGGGMYAGSIAGVRKIIKNYRNDLVVFVSGLSDPADADIREIMIRNELGVAKLFVFHGGYEFDKLTFRDKLIIRVVRKAMSKDMTQEEKAAMYGNVIDFTNRAAIAPLVEYVNDIAAK